MRECIVGGWREGGRVGGRAGGSELMYVSLGWGGSEREDLVVYRDKYIRLPLISCRFWLKVFLG